MKKFFIIFPATLLLIFLVFVTLFLNSFENELCNYNDTFATKNLEKFMDYFDCEKIFENEIENLSDADAVDGIKILSSINQEAYNNLKKVYIETLQNSLKNNFILNSAERDIKTRYIERIDYFNNFLFKINIKNNYIFKKAKNINDVYSCHPDDVCLYLRFTKTNKKWKIENLPIFAKKEDINNEQ